MPTIPLKGRNAVLPGQALAEGADTAITIDASDGKNSRLPSVILRAPADWEYRDANGASDYFTVKADEALRLELVQAQTTFYARSASGSGAQTLRGFEGS